MESKSLNEAGNHDGDHCVLGIAAVTGVCQQRALGVNERNDDQCKNGKTSQPNSRGRNVQYVDWDSKKGERLRS